MSAGYVGFANLPNQVHRKSVKRGFEFTLLVVGESGLGKSTLINTLFQADLYEERAYPSAADRIEQTVSVSSSTVEIEEKGVKLRLTVVDSPGFGDAVNNEGCWEEIEKFVDQRFQAYLDDESRVNRVKIEDNRVHACLYFVPPNGHGIRPVDVAFMKRLHNKVNIIPIIAKADTLTPDEVKSLKERILADISEHQIDVYSVPLDPEDDETDFAENKAIQESMPFAVVGSTTIIDVAGQKFYGREYPWGTINIQDPNHSDFVKLRNFIIGTHYMDLKETTDTLYENFRSAKLQNLGLGHEGENPLTSLEQSREKRESKMADSEQQMTETFEKKVKEKEDKARENEEKLLAKTKEMEEMLAALRKESEELLKKNAELEAANATTGKKKK